MQIYLLNDNIFRLQALKDEFTGSFLNAATVGVRVLETDGTQVVASQALAYVSASSGDYEVALDKALFASLVDGRNYDVEFNAAEVGVDYNERHRVTAKIRRS